ncbi:hypothetical protein CXB51_030475 [Gossypium anomalum]|uniref:Aminotransferase-like plant mobile domain-containing protein n=1 Tax=Gossypium anomalum TaxID=47600 RepID=A0A8J5YWT9_9ROSI|nr:hypothetical protein CXB51_030475 [Gossypium anomalum]
MAGELIRFDDKHISVEQMQMSVDRILQCYIRNMTGPPSPLIEDYLREAGFLHVAMIGRGCKLDPKLIRLPGDGDAVTGSVHSADWGAVCYELLGAILDNINGEQLVNLVRGLPCWQHCTGRCAGLRDRIKRKSKVAYHYCNHGHGFAFHFYVLEWNHSASYARLLTCLEDIRLLLEQRSEAQFQWTPYEDPAIRAVIPDEYLQNPNAWHVKVPLVNFAIVEMHQSDRVLWQFGFRQRIPVAPEVLDDHHKIDLRQLHTDWPRFWSHCIQMWEDRYDYIPTREPIIVPELACMPEYMPCFRIHGKPYLLSEEERQQQLRAQRERRGPLNSRRRDDDAGPSTAPTQSPGPATRPTQSPGPTVQPSTPTAQPLQMMPGSSPFPITPSGPPIYRQPSHEGSQEGPSGSLLFTNPYHLIGFKHLRH